MLGGKIDHQFYLGALIKENASSVDIYQETICCHSKMIFERY